jgi:penicillin-binding protein 1A
LSKNNILLKIVKWLVISTATFAFMAVIAAYILFNRYSSELPDIEMLRHVQYQIPLSIYSRDNLLFARFGEKKRTPIRIEEAPRQLINAFLAAEDDRFFSHPGVDYKGLFRASLQLLLTGKKKQGGSTITMQVTRNFLLSREKTYSRKIKEIILALQIEREFTKNEILELYLNKIYLGHRAYGVAAAAQVYYGKPLADLNLAQYAMIAGLPKAPSKSNPITNPEKAKHRRNYILRRMLDLGYISQQEFDKYRLFPVNARLHTQLFALSAPYIAEMVRSEMVNQFGEAAYTSGLKVFTTINSSLQTAANQALWNALHQYDVRHGYRGNINSSVNSIEDLKHYKKVGDTFPALVEKVENNIILAQLKNQHTIEIPWENSKWARKFISRNSRGPALKSTARIINAGNIIRVRKLTNGTWALTQIPEVEGAIIALDPVDGSILALTGGFDFQRNKYNRATQSKRQPGSGFKPIIYTTAFENGFTTASIINDAPIVIDDPSQESEWRPENYSRKFFGPTRLRKALVKSRNLISIRLLRKIGINKVISTAKRFGFQEEQLPRSLSLALGSGYANPLQMARVFAVFANEGFLIKPYFIDRIESENGEVLFQAYPEIACPTCANPQTPNSAYAPRIISPQINFIMNSLLRDVVKQGTATKAKQLGRNDLAGKTGTTNEQRDAWFNGYHPSIAATAWVGFDDSSPLGRKETGGKAALPMWIEFMETALKGTPEQPLNMPEGIEKAFIDPNSGLLAMPGGKGLWEYFIEGSAPTEYAYNSTSQPYTTEGNEEKPVEALF